MKFEYMRELLGLQRYGSFTLTSEKMFIAQPSLSRHISAMEKELGVRLDGPKYNPFSDRNYWGDPGLYDMLPYVVCRHEI